MKRIGILSVTFAAVLAIACGGDGRGTDANRPADPAAVGTAGDRDAANRELAARHKDWVEDRLVGGMTEVKLGELASQKGRDADVKAFGRMMVQDHTKAGEELKQFASKHNITAPADLDDEHRDKVERLSKLQGAEFDREYMNTMVDDHEKTVNALEDRLDKEGDNDNPRYTAKKSDNTAESELNQWAANTIPTVRKHLERAREIDQKLDRRTTDNPNR
jgi:putative membrane protein